MSSSAGRGNSEPRVLLLDIENTPYTVHSWDNNPRVPIHHENIVEQAHMICAAWKWEGADRVYSMMIPVGGTDYELTKELQRVISEADAVVAHFGDGHDIPWIASRCLIHGLGPLKPVVQIDTWKIAKRKFKLFNNKLAYLAEVLGLPGKIETTFNLWKLVKAGDSEARKQMLLYNEQDVRVLDQVWTRIKPFEVAKLNRAQFVTDEDEASRTCPSCGAQKLAKWGMHYTRTGTRRTYKCSACKAWSYKVKSSSVPR